MLISHAMEDAAVAFSVIKKTSNEAEEINVRLMCCAVLND